ncbi:GGDEF domain-containing protein [Nodosilinea sp. LEGE 07088]|uniref:GGDEF domain-containing protein n=1 Tax=Nodosilinea sp. LEGE 07088 TaxID=2777968 RepID=UPI00187DE7CC|nr:GGDEF domain-containing protein [Nodosilinea sp. LEGE 07088]MBE9137910.1 GGDEF domain-containing protein [Nodosilinea sp. LEGE 07088]
MLSCGHWRQQDDQKTAPNGWFTVAFPVASSVSSSGHVEEFLVVLTTTTPAEIVQTAERLRKRLENYSHPGVGRVTASFGIAVTTSDEILDTLIHRADEALYAAKQQGRNRVSGAPVKI